MERRSFIAGGGVLVTAAAAGCLGAVPGLGGGDGIDTSSPEAVVDSYLTVMETPSDISEDDIERLWHSQVLSQTQGSLGAMGAGQTDTDLDVSITDVKGPTLASEDVSAAQIRETLQSGVGSDTGQSVQPDVFDAAFIEELAADETALVDVRFTYRSEYESSQSDETQTLTVTTSQRVIVAREDGEWQIVVPVTRDIETGA